MKKLLLLAVSILLFSCSGDDSSSTTPNNSTNADTINPPAWVQGTWLSELPYQYGLKFISDDVCFVQTTSQTCNKENLNAFHNAGAYTNVEETISDTEYKVEITIQSNTTVYNVKKISSNQIEWVNGSNMILTKLD